MRDLEGEIVGDYPANIHIIPGAISVDSVASTKGLVEGVKQKLGEHPDIMREARRLGKDVVGLVRSHGKEIIIGAGVASLAIGVAATGAVVMHRHRRRE